MNGIGDFFNKFKNIAIFELKKRESIINTIEELTKQKIEMKDISIKDGIIYIKANSGLKSEIFLKKNRILEVLSKKLQNIRDIK